MKATPLAIFEQGPAACSSDFVNYVPQRPIERCAGCSTLAFPKLLILRSVSVTTGDIEVLPPGYMFQCAHHGTTCSHSGPIVGSPLEAADAWDKHQCETRAIYQRQHDEEVYGI